MIKNLWSYKLNYCVILVLLKCHTIASEGVVVWTIFPWTSTLFLAVWISNNLYFSESFMSMTFAQISSILSLKVIDHLKVLGGGHSTVYIVIQVLTAHESIIPWYEVRENCLFLIVKTIARWALNAQIYKAFLNRIWKFLLWRWIDCGSLLSYIKQCILKI